jgi:hypothetical protein
MADYPIKGPEQKVGAAVAKILPRLGGPGPGDAVGGIPRLGPSTPAEPKEKKGSPDKRRPDYSR